MKKTTWQIDFTAFDSPEEMPEPDRALLALAKKSLENSYSPYSRFKVGAAVMLENGETLGGSNYENASFPLCICAEQVVLSAAANRFPGVPVVAIAVTVKNPNQLIERPAPPCGACRQVICETERKNRQPMRLILQGETGAVFVFNSGQDLLPLAFDESFL
jgi:cytidine deaminase